jgi:hypothetical protein
MAAGRAGNRLAIIGANLDGALWPARPRMSCCRSGVPTLEMVWRSRRRRPASRSRRPRTPWKPYRSSSAHNPDRPPPPMLGAGYSPLSWSSWRTWPNVKRPRVASTDRLALDESSGSPDLDRLRPTSSGTEATRGLLPSAGQATGVRCSQLGPPRGRCHPAMAALYLHPSWCPAAHVSWDIVRTRNPNGNLRDVQTFTSIEWADSTRLRAP